MYFYLRTPTVHTHTVSRSLTQITCLRFFFSFLHRNRSEATGLPAAAAAAARRRTQTTRPTGVHARFRESAGRLRPVRRQHLSERSSVSRVRIVFFFLVAHLPAIPRRTTPSLGNGTVDRVDDGVRWWGGLRRGVFGSAASARTVQGRAVTSVFADTGADLLFSIYAVGIEFPFYVYRKTVSPRALKTKTNIINLFVLNQPTV